MRPAGRLVQARPGSGQVRAGRPGPGLRRRLPSSGLVGQRGWKGGNEGGGGGKPAVCLCVCLSVVTLKRPSCGSEKGDTERSSLRGEEGFSPRHNVRPALRGGVEAAQRLSRVFYGVGVPNPPGGSEGPISHE